MWLSLVASTISPTLGVNIFTPSNLLQYSAIESVASFVPRTKICNGKDIVITADHINCLSTD